MLQRPQMPSSDPHRIRDNDPIVLHLLTTNDPPSSADRARIKSNTQALEAEFLNVTGLSYSKDLELDDGLPRGVIDCYSAIADHKAVLSWFRSIPLELLQCIFIFAVFRRAPGSFHGCSHDKDALSTICRVSKSWRLAATTACALWTHLPRFKVPYYRKDDRSRLLNRYLSRSGSLPLTVTMDVWEAWDGGENIVRREDSKFFASLLSVSDRWGYLDISIDGSPEPVECLFSSNIKGKLRSLSALRISFEEAGWSEDLPSAHIGDHFSDAPLLQRVELCGNYPEGSTGEVVLPWSQLKVMRGDMPQRGALAYAALLGADSPKLEKLYYTITPGFWKEFPFPMVPRSLPNLTELAFNLQYITQNQIDLFTAHLDGLSLPSLTSLTLDLGLCSGPRPFDQLSSNLVSLIQRSGCRLVTLTVIDRRGACFASDTFLDVLLVCPSLTRLDIPKTPELFHRLTIGSSSSTPILPRLTTLNLRRNSAEVRVSVSALMDMVSSRAGSIRSNSKLFRPLEEVLLERVDILALQRGLSEWEAKKILHRSPKASQALSGQGLPYSSLQEVLDLATEAVATLEGYLLSLRENKASMLPYMEADRVVKRLEELHVDELNMLVFFRMEVVHKLANIHRTEVEEWYLRDERLRLRDRTSRLLHEWKPSLARGVIEACPYLLVKAPRRRAEFGTWIFMDDGDSARLVLWAPWGEHDIVYDAIVRRADLVQ